MSPIAVEPASPANTLNRRTTRRWSNASRTLRPRAWKRICAVRGFRARGRRLGFDLSNAQVAKTLRCKVIIVTQAASANRLTKSASTGRCLKRRGRNHGIIINKVLEENIPNCPVRWPRSQAQRIGTARSFRINKIACNPTVGLSVKNCAPNC